MKWNSGYNKIGAFLLAVALLLSVAPLAIASEIVSYPAFQNALRTGSENPDASISSSVSFYGGTTGPYSPPGSGVPQTIPVAGDTGIQLASSAFGQSFSSRPSPKDLNRIIISAQEMLYPHAAIQNPSRDEAEGSNTAFRYKPLLYSPGTGGIRIDLEKFESWFGDSERQLARKAIAIIRSVLQQDPLSEKARNTLLDAPKRPE